VLKVGPGAWSDLNYFPEEVRKKSRLVVCEIFVRFLSTSRHEPGEDSQFQRPSSATEAVETWVRVMLDQELHRNFLHYRTIRRAVTIKMTVLLILCGHSLSVRNTTAQARLGDMRRVAIN